MQWLVVREDGEGKHLNLADNIGIDLRDKF
jgi:hypothetical protein